jgi:hypothetical protein
MSSIKAALNLALRSGAANAVPKRSRSDASCASDGLRPIASVDPGPSALRGVIVGAPPLARSRYGGGVGPRSRTDGGRLQRGSRYACAPRLPDFVLGA